MLSSSPCTRSALAMRLIRALESSSPSTRLPRSWPRPRTNSSSDSPRSATSAISARHSASTSSTLAGRTAGIDAEHPAVGVVRGVGVDGVRQAALLAHLLEQPRAHAAAERGVEHAGGEPPVVAPAQTGQPEHQVGLLGRPASPGRPRCRSRPRQRSAGPVAAGRRCRRRKPPAPKAVRSRRTTARWSTLPATATTIDSGA